MTVENRHAAAVRYARAGLPVFPCAGKIPRLPGGFKAASTDEQTIDQWAWKWPGSNWATPVPAGTFVLDVDPRHGGEDSLATLTAGHGPLPATMTVATPSGGRHLWFTASGPIRQTAGELGEGLDTRAHGKGYVLLPPSWTKHGAYQWANRAETTAAPNWLTAMLRPAQRQVRHLTVKTGGRGYGPAALNGECERVAATPEGQRNTSLHLAAWRMGQLVAAGTIDPETVARHLLNAAQKAGLGENEAVATITSGMRAGMGTPRGVPA